MGSKKKREKIPLEQELPKRRVPHKPTKAHDSKKTYKRSREDSRWKKGVKD
jgi:hypothetical protein